MSRIYADYNATTRPDPEVCALVAEVMQRGFGNPSSMHGDGQEARRAVERARTEVAGLIGAEPDEIVFTSGGTEADNLAVLGAVGASKAGRRVLVTSAIEHHAILAPCEQWRAQGGCVKLVGVDAAGRLDLDVLDTALGPEVALVSIMLANNDTGVIQPVAEAARMASGRGVLVHTDAVQAAGKMAIDVKPLGVSMLTLSSHKIHGPKGVGALYLRRSLHLAPRLFGGRQERSLRPGTENVPGIVGFGKACALAQARLESDGRRVRGMRDRFEARLLARVPEARINGDRREGARLPNTANVSFPGLDGEAMTINLDLLGISVSTGAACSLADHTPSHVLVAMGQSEVEARSSVRFSFGRENTDAEIDSAVTLVAQAVDLLRGARP